MMWRRRAWNSQAVALYSGRPGAAAFRSSLAAGIILRGVEERLVSAQELARRLTERRETVVDEVLAAQGTRWRASELPVGVRADTTYLLTMLSEALACESPELFHHCCAWLWSLRAAQTPDRNGHGAELLADVRDAAARELPVDGAGLVAPYLDEQAVRASGLECAPEESLLPTEGPQAELARAYLRAVLSGDRREAVRLVLEATDQGVTVREIYLQVFQPVQHEIGRLWQVGRINVAQEHYATAITQLAIAQLYPRIVGGPKNGRTLVASSVGAELHELGLRMVADFFEMEGWETCYLGANVPHESVVETIVDRQADVLALSVTLPLHVSRARRLIEAVRASSRGDVLILVGGYVFNRVPTLWRKLGADGYAPSADAAVDVVRLLVEC